MKNYSIVFKNTYTKDLFCDYCRKNYILFETSGYYDRGYYVAVTCMPSVVDELNNYLDEILENELNF